MKNSKTMPRQIKVTAKELRESGNEILVKAVEKLADHCECFVSPEHLPEKKTKKAKPN